MPTWLESASAFASAAVFLGYLVFGLTGFGSALVIIPLLSWAWPLHTIVPQVLLLDIAASLLHTGLHLRQVQWRVIPALLPFAIAGAWVGTYLHRWSDSALVLGLLGAYIVWVSIQNLRKKRLATVPSSLSGTAIAAMVMGLVETLLGTAGPVVMTWLTGRVKNVDGLRATAPLVILIMVCIALTANGLSGHLDSPTLLPRLALLTPMALAGVWAGHRLHAHIPKTMALPLIHVTLLLSGLALVARTIFSLSHPAVQ